MISFFTSTNQILVFHEISSKEWLKEALSAIGKVYRFVRLEEVEAYFYENKVLSKTCHITWDDGDRTFYDNAFPVLKELNIPATVFVSPSIIRNNSNYWFQEIRHIKTQVDDSSIKKIICRVINIDFRLMRNYSVMSILKSLKIDDILCVIEELKKKFNITIEQKLNINLQELHELDDSGVVTIGAHTMHHPILANESEISAREEISTSINKLSGMLKKEIKYFAYPEGQTRLDFGPREQDFLKENNIKLSFSSVAGCFNKKSNPLDIPRGGFGGLSRETPLYILSKLFLMPTIWSKISLRNNKEIQEREAVVKTLTHKTISF